MPVLGKIDEARQLTMERCRLSEQALVGGCKCLSLLRGKRRLPLRQLVSDLQHLKMFGSTHVRILDIDLIML
jgi:hypothetical protein